jgi:hypothetical protein
MNKKSTSVKPETTGWYFVIANDGRKSAYNYTGSPISYITMREQYTHWIDETPSTPPQQVRTAEEIEQMAESFASEFYDKDSERVSAMPECTQWENRKHNWAVGFTLGFREAMELYCTQPEEREERLRIAGEAWDAGGTFEYAQRFPASISGNPPNKEEYLSSLK